MSFKSQAQIAKLTQMEADGKLPKGTVAQKLRDTPEIEKLPERVGQPKPSPSSRIGTNSKNLGGYK